MKKEVPADIGGESMPLNPKSIQIAGVATATIVAFGLAVASATKTEPVAQQTASPRVSPGAAAVEETETADVPTPTPTPTPVPTATEDSSSHDNDDNSDDDNGNDTTDTQDWLRHWQEQRDAQREEARRRWEDNVREAQKRQEDRMKQWKKFQQDHQGNHPGPFRLGD